MNIREAREAAFWPLWRRWQGTPKSFLAALLDKFEEIDQQAMASWRYRVGGVIYEAADVTVYAPDVAGFDFEADDGPAPAAPAKPAPRRRTRT